MTEQPSTTSYPQDSTGQRSTSGTATVGRTAPLLSVQDLTVTFGRGDKAFTAVDHVNFDVAPGQTVGLVGESGCGKSVTSLAIMRLLPSRGNTVTGSVTFDGQDLLTLSDTQMRDRRGSDVAMIFQDPLSSLNPVVPLGIQVAEVLERHKGMKRGPAMERSVELLNKVGIPDPQRRLREYAHQLSGGMRQRALIAMALACEPRLLIADEPTTALDVTIQAQILALLRELVQDSGTALVMITHDLGVIAGLCDEVNVLYAGKVVERAQRHDLFATPRHPYTGGLLSSIPRLTEERGRRLTPVPGSVADNIDWAQGCAFAPRCASATDVCFEQPPELVTDRLELGPDRLLRCHHPLESNPLNDSSGRNRDDSHIDTTEEA
ncbi:MAG: ABC transporter ATP-binding protein [Ornithinimicrobium sp.]|uniref:ABC transporter ATP-binding protein n=1 Tax=Ornithinimicrobium sp. TaxID=1977084 RepID=UPI0026E0030F|nr:ABC transporter ATP-binding protein [Ornithinimicrobium sp.]MDO5739081.1 ABC transporter ATP-binding protein [Ornithinimicrobium sp.]